MAVLSLGIEVLIEGLIWHFTVFHWANRIRKRRPKLVVALAVIYFGSYTLLSVNGAYIMANHGGDHWSRTWCPAYVMVEYQILRTKIRPTVLAACYLPLVVLDRLIVHPVLEPWPGYYDGSYRRDRSEQL